MFWRERERERETKHLNSGPPCGQVRVLVVGDSGVGKTSLVHLIVNGSAISRPSETIGYAVGVKHIKYGNFGSTSSSVSGDSERDFFVELWDVSGHERYKDCRSLFYSQINGSGWPGGLPVPYIVISNKSDIASKEAMRGSSGNLVDVARQWVEKQGLLPASEQLPLTEIFPSSGSLTTAAKEAKYDKEAIIKCFHMLIGRRYLSDELPAPNPWHVSPVPKPASCLDDDIIDKDPFYRGTSLNSDQYNAFPPLPAQRNLTPPPTLCPQQPVTVLDNHNFPRFSSYGSSPDINRSNRMDINV